MSYRTMRQIILRENIFFHPKTMLKAFSSTMKKSLFDILQEMIMYDHILSENSIVEYGFWFDNEGKIKWLDMDYPSPWE
jgi:hypothetical protein